MISVILAIIAVIFAAMWWFEARDHADTLECWSKEIKRLNRVLAFWSDTLDELEKYKRKRDAKGRFTR